MGACAPRMGALSSANSAELSGADALLRKIAWNLIEHSPGTATGLGIDTGEHAYLRSRLGDASPEGIARLAETIHTDLSAVRAFDKAGLSTDTLTSMEVVESAYETALEGFALPYGDVSVCGWRNAPYVVIQNVGAYIDVPRFLGSDHPVRTAGDAEAYLARLEAYPAILDGERERMEAATAQGVIPPGFLLDAAIGQMESTLADARNGGGLVTSLTDRTQDIPGAWESRAKAIVQDQVSPALERQLGQLRQQRGKATQDAGLWARPHGDEWYRWALKAATTTTLEPDEIHAIGLEQVAEIHGRMDAIFKGIGYASGSVGERMIALAEDPRFKFPAGDEGRAQIMQFMHERIDWIREQMPRAFGKLVDANLEIRRLPLSEEPGAPSAYGGAGSIDGSIPGKIWLNLLSTDYHRTYTLTTLAYHEGIPGHVWQGEYANQLPLIRSILQFNAYSEGWALYAEQLADELGAYEEHPEWRLGYLQDQAYRACRLVVDTGLHAKRWTREQAIEWFHRTNGNPLTEVTREVDRYCSWPGQACGYKIGHNEMLRQRELVRAAQGNSFDLRGFNDLVVTGGNVPLDVLGANVERYIAGTS